MFPEGMLLVTFSPSVIQIPTTTTTPIIPKKNHETSTVGTVQVADPPC